MAIDLIGLQPSAYEHPMDRQTLSVVKQIPLLPQITNWIMDYTAVRWEIIQLQGRDYHLTHDACEELYDNVCAASHRLDIPMPPVYITQAYGINAYTMGHKEKAYVVLFSGAVDRLNKDELTFIVGHEMGHIKSGHVLYQNMVNYMTALVKRFPLINEASKIALFKWMRMAEFTADRAGLLACQDINTALSAMMKMSGLPMSYYNKASVQGFINQIHTFKRTQWDAINKGIASFENLLQDHPWTILRATELLDWYESGEYQKVIDGVHANTKMCPVHNGLVPIDTKTCPICGHQF